MENIRRGDYRMDSGFQYGSAILQFDAVGEKSFLESGRKKDPSTSWPRTSSHTGVH